MNLIAPKIKVKKPGLGRFWLQKNIDQSSDNIVCGEEVCTEKEIKDIKHYFSQGWGNEVDFLEYKAGRGSLTIVL